MTSASLSLLQEIKSQAQHPSSGDPYIHAFFQSLSRSENGLINLMAQAQEKRNKEGHYLTKAHAVYLPVHIINYLMIFLEHKPDYPFRKEHALLTPEGWHKLIDYLLHKYHDLFMKLLIEKDVQQNIYQRGVSVPLFVHTLLSSKQGLKVADLGCSANLVWGFIITHSKFDPIIDHTSWNGKNNIVNLYGDKHVDVALMRGLDYHYPLKTKEGTKWLLACRHPREVRPELIQKTETLIHSYVNLPHITIEEGDFVTPRLPKGEFDIVTMNNTLYQLPEEKRSIAIAKAKELLNSSGVLIIQDNCSVQTQQNARRIVFTDSRNAFTYRVCITGPVVEKVFNQPWLEVLQFKSTRCHEVKKGEQFDEYMQVYGATI